MKWSLVRRYYGMFAIAYQDVLQARSIELVWLLLSILNTSVTVLFWIAGFANGSISNKTSLPNILLYYVLVVICSQGLMSHVEEDVSRNDIREGGLVKHLMHPISYFWFRFWTEIPWRVGGFTMSLLGLLIMMLLFHLHLSIPLPALVNIVPICVLLILALFLSYCYKIVLSLTTFWILEGWALFEFMDIAVIFLAGYLMPLPFFPDWVQKIAFALPFAYMIYMPVQAVMGQLDLTHLLTAIGMQLLWIGILVCLYKLMWKRGLAIFTGVGQ